MDKKGEKPWQSHFFESNEEQDKTNSHIFWEKLEELGLDVRDTKEAMKDLLEECKNTGIFIIPVDQETLRKDYDGFGLYQIAAYREMANAMGYKIGEMVPSKEGIRGKIMAKKEWKELQIQKNKQQEEKTGMPGKPSSYKNPVKRKQKLEEKNMINSAPSATEETIKNTSQASSQKTETIHPLPQEIEIIPPESLADKMKEQSEKQNKTNSSIFWEELERSGLDVKKAKETMRNLLEKCKDTGVFIMPIDMETLKKDHKNFSLYLAAFREMANEMGYKIGEMIPSKEGIRGEMLALKEGEKSQKKENKEPDRPSKPKPPNESLADEIQKQYEEQVKKGNQPQYEQYDPLTENKKIADNIETDIGRHFYAQDMIKKHGEKIYKEEIYNKLLLLENNKDVIDIRKRIKDNVKKAIENDFFEISNVNIFYKNHLDNNFMKLLAAYYWEAESQGFDIENLYWYNNGSEKNVRGNLVPKLEVKKKRRVQKEGNKEEGDKLYVPNKLLKRAIGDVGKFFNDEPDAENIYDGLRELSELDIAEGKKTEIYRNLLESFWNDMESRFGTYSGGEGDEGGEEYTPSPDSDITDYKGLSSLQGWYKQFREKNLYGKLYKDIEKIPAIPFKPTTAEEDLEKAEKKKIEKNEEDRKTFETAVKGTIFLGLFGLGDWLTGTYVSFFKNLLELSLFNPLEKGAKFKWSLPDWWPEWLGGKSQKNNKK